MLEIKIQTEIPISKAYIGDSGFDLPVLGNGVVPPGKTRIIGTGVFIELEPGLEGQVRSRSGLAAKHSVHILNSPGTVDSDYRGEIKLILHNSGRMGFKYERGDRLAQLVVQRVPLVTLKFVESINSNTDRGVAGLGSTGVS